MSHKVFFSILGSGVEWNCFSNFGAEPLEEPICETILKSASAGEKMSLIDLFLFLALWPCFSVK